MDSCYTSCTSYIAASPEPAWTPACVEKQLKRAVAVTTSMTVEQPAAETAAGHHPCGSAAEALSWLGWLSPDDTGIVVARLEGASWKAICWRFGISRPTADRRWRYALALIAWRLNGHSRSRAVPSLRSLLGLRRAA